MNSEELYLLINPKRFHYLKNLLEGYDGLAIISSHDIKNGIIRIKYLPESKAVLFGLLSSIAPNLRQTIS